MHKDFQLKANELLLKNINKTREHIISGRKQLVSALMNHLNEVCSIIACLQNESSIPPISSIEYTMFRTNFINRRYVAEVWVYGDGWYIDPNPRMIAELDLSDQFIYYDKLWDELIKERKQRYRSEVRPIELLAYMMLVLPNFFSHLVNIARSAIFGNMDSNSFEGIKKHNCFRVNVGEYMNINGLVPVYTEVKEKNSDDIVKLFDKRKENVLVFGDYSDKDFSGCEASSMNLSFSQFRHSSFNNSVFHNAELKGANFHRAIMDNCQILKCRIHEANYSQASLKGANFMDSHGSAASPSSSNLQFADHVGLMPVSFKHADLTNACLRNTCLAGADFEGAKLDGADFTNADLSYANFANASLSSTDFTDADLDGTIFSVQAKSIEKSAGKNHDTHGPAKLMQMLDTVGCQSARHFLMEGSEQAHLPPAGEPKKVTIVDKTVNFTEIDYDEKRGLISDRLKILIKMCMPFYEFDSVPFVFMSEDRAKTALYWKFDAPVFERFNAAYRNDGMISHIKLNDNKTPLIFTAISPEGMRSMVVHLAVAESALRRSILGIKFTRLQTL